MSAYAYRSENYLAFVRAQECAWCVAPGPSDPHHFGGRRGTATKTDDTRTVPLCRGCHDTFHRTGCVGVMDRDATRVWFYEHQLRLMTEYISRLEATRG